MYAYTQTHMHAHIHTYAYAHTQIPSSNSKQTSLPSAVPMQAQSKICLKEDQLSSTHIATPLQGQGQWSLVNKLQTLSSHDGVDRVRQFIVNNHFIILASIILVHYQPTKGDTIVTYTIQPMAINSANVRISYFMIPCTYLRYAILRVMLPGSWGHSYC